MPNKDYLGPNGVEKPTELPPPPPLTCEGCGRIAGIVDCLSRIRTYCIHVKKSKYNQHKMLCQYCRAKE